MTIYSLDVLLSQFGTNPIVPSLVLTVASCPAYRFLRRKVRWSGIPISLRIFHSLLWSTQSKALVQSMKQVFWGIPLYFLWTSFLTQMVKNLLAMRETWVQSLGLGRSPGEENTPWRREQPPTPVFLPG